MAIVFLRRFAPLLIGLSGFAGILVATALSAPAWVVGAVLLASIGLASAASRPVSTRRAESAPELYASDGYSDAYLGRSAPTHPTIDTRPLAQYGPGLPADPLHLPGDGAADRGDR
ncbi:MULTISPECIES: hypothetical protein [unclassified Microbacterium]|uniref:hypothetical protein n=1 Tax=unclassified Microbacterium TaxID=2609290 RepID=UPI00386DD790